jgi:hypothetical protein
MKNEYIIQGRFVDGNWYLYTLAGTSLEQAKKTLAEVVAGPEKYKADHKLYREFRILEVNSCECWWNQGTLD